MTAPARPKQKIVVESNPWADADIEVLRAACEALTQSSSRRILEAHITFINDYFLWHPSPSLPERLR